MLSFQELIDELVEAAYKMALARLTVGEFPDTEKGQKKIFDAEDVLDSAKDAVLQPYSGIVAEYGMCVGRNQQLRDKIKDLTEWRPMSTAPKTGDFILIKSCGYVHKAAWKLNIGSRPPSYEWCIELSWKKESNQYVIIVDAEGWLPLPPI